MNRKDSSGNETKVPDPKSVRRVVRAGGERSSVSPTRPNPVRGWVTPDTDPDLAGDSMAIDPDELREFLSADGTDAKADPVFKQRLRETLWKMVEDQYGPADDEPEDH